MSQGSTCRERRLVDKHFEGRVTPAEEAELRAHLPDCTACRARYDRHLLFADLAHTGPPPADRIALGLGLQPPSRPSWATLLLPAARWRFVGAAAAIGVAVLVARAALDRDREFVARGRSAAVAPTIEVYRVPKSGAPVPADGWFAPGEELAFSYRNPTGFARVLVFGVDDAGKVYWFHPGWMDARLDPVAVPIVRSDLARELEAAIHHDVGGRRLRIVALFTNALLSVRAVEERVHAGRLDLADSTTVETTLEVRR